MHGMQKVRGSNPLSSTGFPDLCSIFSDNPSDNDYAFWASSLSKMLYHAE